MPDTEAPHVPRLVAVVAVAMGVAAAGATIGLLWAQVAPAIHGAVALTRDGERVRAYLGDEGEHFFVAPFLMLGLLAVLAVLAATLAWQWVAHRGPGMVAGLSIGLVASAALAVLVGAQLVHRRYGVVDVEAAPVTPDHRVSYFTEAPPVFFGQAPMQIAATLLLPAAAAALAYALGVTWTHRDDLGGYPPAPDLAEPRVTADGGAPPGR
ncbi:MAG TPA: DUF2567 domain-containing protein [Mycobacterium sp.]|nr:DUF2567 domain-containing protein [Mycobacterium sp.]